MLANASLGCSFSLKPQWAATRGARDVDRKSPGRGTMIAAVIGNRNGSAGASEAGGLPSTRAMASATPGSIE